MEVVHVCWLVCCELELDESLLDACLPMAVHVLKLHWWQVRLLWLELRVSSVEVGPCVLAGVLEWAGVPGYIGGCMFAGACPCPLAAALVAGVVVVAGAGGVICGGCPCVLAGVL